MDSNFASVLDMPSTEVTRPPPLPIGTYHCVLRGQPKYDKSAKKQTPYVEFTAAPQAVLDDVDEDQLAEALNGRALTDVTFPITFYYEAQGQGYRLKMFLKAAGIDIESGQKLRVLIDDTPNSEVLVTMKHESNNPNDPEAVQARPATFAPVP